MTKKSAILATANLRHLCVVLAMALVLLTGCSVDEVIGDYRDTAPPVSPVAIANLPDDIEALTLTVANGEFGSDDMFLLEGAPTQLRVTNSDDQDYRFQIVEALVTPTEIPANATTPVSFTTPNAAEFEGQLLALQGDDVLDTIRVVVRSAGGVQP